MSVSQNMNPTIPEDMIPTGDKTLPDREPVPCPQNHFNKFFRPEGYNLGQIFLSPSLHYCTCGEVYAGSLRFYTNTTFSPLSMVL